MIRQISGLLLLFVNWFGCFALCRELAARKQIHSDWRVSWLLACVGWGVLLTAIIELASSLRILTRPTLTAAWLGTGLILWSTAGWLTLRRGPLSKLSWIAWRERVNLDWRRNWPLDARLMAIASAVLVFGLGVIAAATPTTNLDSLTYHLPRVMHWIQQQSVEHFPTGNTRQLEFAPWPAFVITNLHLLIGDDQLDNLVQWFAMLTSVIVTSFVSQQLLQHRNAGTAAAPGPPLPTVSTQRRVTALSCLLVTTLPIGLVESITTQTDYVVTCWFACLTCLTLALWHEPANFWYALGAGLALALGVLSKVTMFIFAAPLGLAIAWCVLFRLPDNRLRWRLVLSFVIAFFAINAPHLLRNYGVFGSPLGSRYILSIGRNKTVSMGGTASNILRNLVLETNSAIPPVTKLANNFLLWLHGFTGRDLNDPDTTYHEGRFLAPSRFVVFDSYASNFYHLVLIFLAGVLALRNLRRCPVLLGYALSMVIGFLLFCALLRWQQWHCRVHLTWLVMLAPWASLILTLKTPRWLGQFAGIVVGVFAVYSGLHNISRPVLDVSWLTLPREALYLKVDGQELYSPLMLAAEDVVLSKCAHIGLNLDFDSPEYPIWIMLQNRRFTGRLSHFLVKNESAGVPSSEPPPCAVIFGATNVTAELTNRFPYHLDYGPVKTFWSEPASHWSRLAEFDSDNQELHLLPPTPPPLLFEHNRIDLRLRSPRAGTLHLAGRVTGATGKPINNIPLRVTTDSGFEQTPTAHSGTFSVLIPSAGGDCKITLALAGATPGNAAARLPELHWRWETGDVQSSEGQAK